MEANVGNVMRKGLAASGVAIVFFVGFFPFYEMLAKQDVDMQTAAYFSWMTPAAIWWNVKIWPVMITEFKARLKK